MADYIDNNTVDLAVLSVPKEKAVEVAKELIENGVNAIWNFTNVELTEPNSPVLVENIHFSDSLLSLSYFISEANDEKAAREQRLRIRNV
jgi:redox-sensing transcriptional repressor